MAACPKCSSTCRVADTPVTGPQMANGLATAPAALLHDLRLCYRALGAQRIGISSPGDPRNSVRRPIDGPSVLCLAVTPHRASARDSRANLVGILRESHFSRAL